MQVRMVLALFGMAAEYGEPLLFCKHLREDWSAAVGIEPPPSGW